MAPTRALHRAALALPLLTLVAEASPEYIAQLCQGERCDEMTHPILDWDPERQKCICIRHPCWSDDAGKKHFCENPTHPHLTFSYDENKQLKCGCSAWADTTTKHVALELCYGHRCDDSKFPILNYNNKSNKCACSENPCWNADGFKHSCSADEAPVLNFRLDKDGKKICECKRSWSKYAQEEL